MRALPALLLALVLAVALPGAMSAAAAAEPRVLEEATIGNWRGAAIAENGERFSFCAILAGYQHGIDLTFAIGPTPSQLWIGLSSRRWSLDVGTRASVAYRVDRGPTWYGSAVATHPDMVEIAVPQSAELFDRLRNGRALYVELPETRTDFRLTGTNRALRWLRGCAEAYAAPRGGNPLGAGASDAIEPPQPAADAVPSSAAYPADRAVMLLANALAAASVAGFELAPGEDAGVVRWWTPVLAGTLELLPSTAGEELAALRGELLGNAAGNCDGVFTSTNGETDAARLSLTTRCARDAGTTVSASALLLSAGTPLLLTVEGPDPVAADVATAMFAAAAERADALR